MEPHHIVYVARGETSFAPTAAAIEHVKAWSRARLHFTVLAGERALVDIAAGPAIENLDVINATDAAMLQRLRSPLARAWLQRTLSIGGKQHTYTVPKLFLYELLPDVQQAITLDADIMALADIAELADHVRSAARSDPHAALFYASEQQNKYRWVLNWTRAGHPWPVNRSGVNGGVGVQILHRLRASHAYHDLLRRLLTELDERGLFVGGFGERRAALELGDQTAFSAAAVIAPAAWSQLFRLLPCEWNWQTCVWSYGRVHECPLHDGKLNTSALAEAGYADLGCATRPHLHDGSCHSPPRLLHFDCPGDLKALLVGGFRGIEQPRGSGDHAHNDSHARVTGHAGVVDHTIFSRLMSTRRVTEQDADRAVVELRSALNQTRAKAMCRRADSRPIGASGRLGLPSATFCNASFLLTRMRERADGQR